MITPYNQFQNWTYFFVIYISMSVQLDVKKNKNNIYMLFLSNSKQPIGFRGTLKFYDSKMK